MPKIVDHDQKRQFLAEVVWKIINEEGVEKASIRRIASEAGMSPGALRHYFSTQDEILLFVIDYYVEHGRLRSQDQRWPSDPLQAVRDILFELIPTDDEKQIEAMVWWTFAFRSLNRPSLKRKKEELTDGMYELSKAMIELLIASGLVPDTIDVELEMMRLSALLDGLSSNSLLRNDVFSADKMKQIIEHHIKSICKTT